MAPRTAIAWCVLPENGLARNRRRGALASARLSDRAGSAVLFAAASAEFFAFNRWRLWDLIHRLRRIARSPRWWQAHRALRFEPAQGFQFGLRLRFPALRKRRFPA